MDETEASAPNPAPTETGRGSGETQPLVVSVVVNYRGLVDTLTCVSSLLDVEYARHLVVVVDNGSGDAEGDALAAGLPATVQYIRSNANLGYGGGANLGLRWAVEAGADYAWVLNNDTTVDRQAVAELVRAMESDPSCGASSPQIEASIGPDSPRGVWYAGGTADLGRVTTEHVHDLIDTDALLSTTGYVSGCAIFLRLCALAEVGMFWEPLFLYWEDVELSFRLRAAGWRLAIAPAARIRHIGHDGVMSSVASFYYYRNAILVAMRQLGRRGGARAALALSTRAGRRWLACATKGYRPWPTAETRGLRAGAFALLRGRAHHERRSSTETEN